MNSSAQPLVIDANVGVWSAVQGPGPSPEAVQDWLAGLDKIVVPGLWVYEVTSALYRYRLQGWPPAEMDQALRRILTIPDEIVQPDRPLVISAYAWAIRLGQEAAYDAFYLALAEHLGATFWTGDRRLYNRALQVGAEFVKFLGGEHLT